MTIGHSYGQTSGSRLPLKRPGTQLDTSFDDLQTTTIVHKLPKEQSGIKLQTTTGFNLAQAAHPGEVPQVLSRSRKLQLPSRGWNVNVRPDHGPRTETNNACNPYIDSHQKAGE